MLRGRRRKGEKEGEKRLSYVAQSSSKRPFLLPFRHLHLIPYTRKFDREEEKEEKKGKKVSYIAHWPPNFPIQPGVFSPPPSLASPPNLIYKKLRERGKKRRKIREKKRLFQVPHSSPNCPFGRLPPSSSFPSFLHGISIL